MGLKTKASKEPYDAVIIGAGQACEPLAPKLAGKNFRLAVIEKDLEGGSCVNYGCTPSKAMISSARAAYIIKKSQEWGIHAAITDLNFEEICNRRDRIVEAFRHKITKFLENDDSVDFFRGTATFTGEKKIRIHLSEGGKTDLTAKKIFINTGTRPREIEVEGLSHITYYHAKNWMEIRELPESHACRRWRIYRPRTRADVQAIWDARDHR